VAPDRISDVFIERTRGSAQLGENPRVGPADHAAVSMPRHIRLPFMSPHRHHQGNDDDESDNRRQASSQPTPPELGLESTEVIIY
jgi:hypothetical protein